MGICLHWQKAHSINGGVLHARHGVRVRVHVLPMDAAIPRESGALKRM